MSKKEKDRKNESSSIIGDLVGGDLLRIQDDLRIALFTIVSNNAIFKTKVQSGGRISIPEAERDILGIKEGDIVQVVLALVKKKNDE